MARRSRLSLTLLASVLLHGVAFVVLWRGEAPAPRAAPSSPLEMELVYQTAEPLPQPAPEPRTQPPSPVSPQPPRKVQRQPRQPAAVAQVKEEPAPPESPLPPEPATPDASPQVADVPRAAPRLTLLPQNLPGSVPVEEPPSRGRTVRNLPGEAPDPQAVAEYQAEEAKARVQGWAQDTLAEARASRGATPPYLRQLQVAFSDQLVDPPPPDAEVVGSRMVRKQIATIQHYGKTGDAQVEPQKRDFRLKERNRLQAAAEAGRASSMFMVDVTAPVLALAAIVEVWQEPDGKLRDLKVLESSGDPNFDAWAISRLRNAFAKVGSPPDAGVGIRDDGIRSRWRLEEYLGNPRVQIHLIGIY